MKKLSRRNLLTSGAAASLLAATGLPAASMPRRGGELRLALSGVAAGWDTRAGSGTFARVLGQGAVFDCLTEIAADGTLRGELAEGWTASADARVWHFALRRDVRFHDGVPFTSEDAVASLRLHMDPGQRSPAYPLLADVEALCADGRHGLTVTLRSGNPDFPFLLADHHLLIYPARRMAEAMAQGIGTGLYRVAVSEPGRVRAHRVADHYKDGEAGWFDAVDLRMAPEATERLAMLVRGDVDAVDAVSPMAVAPLARMRRVRPISVTGNRHLAFAAPVGLPEDAANAVRVALRHGLPRGTLVETVLHGHGSEAADHPLGPANRYYAAGLSRAVYDPQRAADALRRAGLTGLPLDLGPLDDPGRGELGRAVAAAGFRLSAGGLRPVYTSGRATEDWAFSIAPASWRPAGTEGERLCGLLRAGRAARASGERRAIYDEMQRAMAAHGRVCIPAHAHFLAAASERLAHGPQIGRLAALDSGRVAERWWFA